MSHPPSLGDCCVALCQCLVRMSRDRTRTIPKYARDTTWGSNSGLMSTASGGRSDRRAQAPLPDANRDEANLPANIRVRPEE